MSRELSEPAILRFPNRTTGVNSLAVQVWEAQHIAVWSRTRPLVPIVILFLVGELFSSGCAPRRVTSIDPQTLDRPQLEQLLDPGSSVRIERRSGAVDRGEVHALRDSTVVLEFESRELIGHADTLAIPLADILSIGPTEPNPVRSVSTFGVGLMLVLLATILVIVTFDIEPIPLGG